MTFTQERIEAYAQLEKAIENLVAVYDKEQETGDEDCILSSWVLITNRVGMPLACNCRNEIDIDDEELRSVMGGWAKRGQNPIMTTGMVRDYLRHCEDVNNNQDNASDS